jgi:hypothetical protein
MHRAREREPDTDGQPVGHLVVVADGGTLADDRPR